jgi:hypothetical protein
MFCLFAMYPAQSGLDVAAYLAKRALREPLSTEVRVPRLMLTSIDCSPASSDLHALCVCEAAAPSFAVSCRPHLQLE